MTENALTVLKERYLIQHDDGSYETPGQMFARVAATIAGAEASHDLAAKWRAHFFAAMVKLDFVPNTPCLVNAGRPNSFEQYSACFVLPVPDTIDGIFQAVHNMVSVHKTGGGTGFDFSGIRPANDHVRSKPHVASGPLPFMTVFDAATAAMKQGGVRRGANMGIMRVDHPDILAFIGMKLDPKVMTNFNVSVAITEKFMAALATDDEYDLINPNGDKVVGRLRARFVWNEIVRCAHTIGDPGLYFVDRVNAKDPLSHTLGPIQAPNPCGEVGLRPFDACSLGSINLANFVVGNDFDWVRLREVVHTAVRFLDNMVSASKFPLEEIRLVTADSRKIGLGVMGWAEALIKRGVAYASSQARSIAQRVMAFINAEAQIASQELAREKGAFPLFERAKYDHGTGAPRRNATVTVIAPTGTISIIAGCSSGIEPLFALSMTRNQAGKTMTELNPLFVQAAKRGGFWSEALEKHVLKYGTLSGFGSLVDISQVTRDVFKVANEIAVDDHIAMQACFQLHTEDAVSKTINMHGSATIDDVAAAYMSAWKQGCKGITVYRDGCRSGQVLVAGTKADTKADPKIEEITKALAEATQKIGDDNAAVKFIMGDGVPDVLLDAQERAARASKRRRVPADGVRSGPTISKPTLFGTVHVTINVHPTDGEPFEMWTRIGKSGSDVNAWTEAFGRTASLMLSLPSAITPRERLRLLASQLVDIGGSDSIGMGAEKIVSAPDAIAKIIVAYLGEINDPIKIDETMPGTRRVPEAVRRDLCPGCNKATLERSSKCPACTSCGWSAC